MSRILNEYRCAWHGCCELLLDLFLSLINNYEGAEMEDGGEESGAGVKLNVWLKTK